jgi:hypothetical protein
MFTCLWLSGDNLASSSSRAAVCGGLANLEISGNSPNEEGTQSDIVSQRFEVIRDEESFLQLWLDHTASVSPPPEPPVIDFEQERVIAVFMGRQPTGGYRIGVTSIEEAPDSLVVNVRATLPGPDCFVTLVETRPYQLVLLPQVPDIEEFPTRNVVAFQTTVEQEDCPAPEPSSGPRQPRRP